MARQSGKPDDGSHKRNRIFINNELNRQMLLSQLSGVTRGAPGGRQLNQGSTLLGPPPEPSRFETLTGLKL